MTFAGQQAEQKRCELCGRPFDFWHEMEPVARKIMIESGSGGAGVFLCTGDKGSGKTHFAAWWCAVLVGISDNLPPPHNPPPEWHIVWNVVLGKYKGTRNNQPQEDPETLLEFDRIVNAHPRYHFANTLADAERIKSELLLEAWNRGRRIHVLQVLDEGPVVGIGGKATQTSVYDERSMSLYKEITLSRKTGTALLVIAIREELLSPKLRSTEDIGGIGLINVVFSKWPKEIEDVAQKSLKDERYNYAYDISGIPYKQLVAILPRDSSAILPSILLVGEAGFARNLHRVPLGAICYDTFSIAGYTNGELNGKPFLLDNLITKMSDKHSSEIPQVYYDYFHPAPPEFKSKQEKEIEQDSQEFAPGEVEEIFVRVTKPNKTEGDVKEDHALFVLQKVVAEDRAALKKYGKLRYPHWTDLYRAANVSEAVFYRLKDELELSYREGDEEGSSGAGQA